ncbi:MULTISPECIES: sensor histidine kinase [unclassified Streptomyces]|uniref:histidine kinase n=1 Tax=Streptomyces sp. NBC_00060 TaxID=2975636 RepID=A0AAU2GTE7_9ACTN
MRTGDTSWRPTRVDIGVSLAAAVYEVRDLLLRGAQDWTFPSNPWFNYAVWLAMSVLLLFRRRWPLPIAVVAIAADVVSFYPAAEAVALYTVGTKIRSYLWQVGILAACGAVHFWVYISGDHGPSILSQLAAHFFIFTATPLLLGLYVATRQRLRKSLEEQRNYINRERILMAEKVRAEERQRITREMHDVVAHRVSHIVMHAGAIEVAALHSRKEEHDRQWMAREAAQIRVAGREALRELRELLLVLKPSDGQAAPLGPQPNLSDLPALIERSRAVGLPVVLENGVHTTLTSSAQHGLYRIVQEALTNVLKHAPGAATHILLAEHGDTLELRVRNAAAPPTTGTASLPGSGKGLAGLRERVSFLNGTLEDGPCADGGFQVRAVIPIAANRLLKGTT